MNPNFDWSSNFDSVPRPYAFSLRDQTSGVTNQKDEGICQMMAVSDMTGMVFRKFWNLYTNLVISPQVLRDAKANSDPKLVKFVCDPSFGLESLTSYPFIPVSRAIQNWNNAADYQMDTKSRFRLQNIKYFYNPKMIKERLTFMFAENGYQYPCVGVLRMGRFIDRDVAAHHARAHPYRHPQQPTSKNHASRLYGGQHALLIIGIDITSPDPNEHFCIVKNTHGCRWGDKGFSKVGFDVFEYVLFPIMKED